MIKRRLLYKIFGSELSSMTKKEIDAAGRVVDYFDVSADASPDTIPYEYNLIDACKYALNQEGVSWDDVMLSKSRKRAIVEYRSAIASIFFKKSRYTPGRNTELLGGKFNRTTLLHSISCAEDWRKYDDLYRALYGRLFKSVNDYLKQAPQSNKRSVF